MILLYKVVFWIECLSWSWSWLPFDCLSSFKVILRSVWWNCQVILILERYPFTVFQFILRFIAQSIYFYCGYLLCFLFIKTYLFFLVKLSSVKVLCIVLTVHVFFMLQFKYLLFFKFNIIILSIDLLWFI